MDARGAGPACAAAAAAARLAWYLRFAFRVSLNHLHVLLLVLSSTRSSSVLFSSSIACA
jgi:hypothetical protein